MTWLDVLRLVLLLSPLSWVWVAYDVNRPRYYDRRGNVHRTAKEAEDADRDQP